MRMSTENPEYASFFGVLGAASALIFCFFGAAYGIVKTVRGITTMYTTRQDLIMKSIILIMMAGVIAMYGLKVAILILGSLDLPSKYSLSKGFMHLCGGLSVGFLGLAAGFAISVVARDRRVRSTDLQLRLFVGMILTLIFEVLDLYGLIVDIKLQ